MRKYSLLVVVLLLGIHACLTAQKDSLKDLESALHDAKTDVERVCLTIRIAAVQRQSGDYTQAAATARTALQLAQGIPSDPLIADAHDQLGLIFQSKHDLTNAMKSFVAALKLREKNKDAAGTALSRFLIGRAFFLQGDLENAQHSLAEALPHPNPEIRAEAHRTLGEVAQKRQIFGEAQQHFRLALDEKIAVKDLTGAAEMARLLGTFCHAIGDIESAIVYFRQSFDLNSSTENIAGMARDHLDLGHANLALAATDAALTHFQTAEQLFRQVRDTVGIAKSWVAQANILPAPKSQRLLADASQLLEHVNMQPAIPQILKEIASIFRRIGNVDMAYQHLLKFTEAEKQVFSIEKNKALLELTTRYQSEFAAEEQQRTIEKLEIERAGSRKVRWLLMGILAFALLTMWALWRSNRMKKRDNKILHQKNVEIDTQNRLLEEQNQRLDELNSRLVGEIANREMLEQNAFDRDRFIALLCREMSSPIQNIIQKTRKMLADKPKNSKGDALRTIQLDASNLLVMLNDLLAYSKIEASKVTTEQEVFELTKAIEEVAAQFETVFSSRDTEFSVCMAEPLPRRVVGDPLRFQQILSNLLTNLSRHDDYSQVQVHIGVTHSDENQLMLRVAVHAIGHTLPSADMEALEQPIALILEGKHSTERGAPVISLALAKRMAQLQNGHFEMENMADAGTAFILHLPFQKVGKRNRLTALLAENPTPLSGKYILIAEDNKINQLVVTKMLEKAGAVVVATDDGLSALEAFRNGSFDLVLMDIQMPKLDGYRTVAEMRKDENPAKRAVPIIALTASAYLTDKEKAELFQMNDHVGKPFSPEELLEKVVSTVLHWNED